MGVGGSEKRGYGARGYVAERGDERMVERGLSGEAVDVVAKSDRGSACNCRRLLAAVVDAKGDDAFLTGAEGKMDLT